MANAHLTEVHNIAQVCAQMGIQRAVLSPGSRCAPLTISFARHPEIETFVIPDERSAAFIALGMAIETQVPTVLICTSGTASLNYYPAIAEAFYQHVPLVVLTADRPPELIDEGDGQCIRQEKVYHNHIKKSYSFPIETDNSNGLKMVEEAIHLANALPKGPVHINVPIKEPFYPELNETISFQKIEISASKKVERTELDLPKTLFKNVVLVAGQENYSPEIINQLASLHVPVICDSISNLHHLPNAITTHDLLLSSLTEEEKKALQPDLLITLGNAILSKSLKQYLRSYKPTTHWYFSNNTISADVFQSITHRASLEDFSHFNLPLVNENHSVWKQKQTEAIEHTKRQLTNGQWNEFNALHKIVQQLPSPCNIHVSNSMSIRYINHLSYLLTENQRIYCNRGTSGIDGSNSTAVGVAICSPEVQNVLITGDLSFFYDRNAFWHKYLPSNLNIIVMNNHGGGIFRMIDGPARQPEHVEYFETPQSLTAQNTANDFGFNYFIAHSLTELGETLPKLATENISLLEILTNTEVNTHFYKTFRKINA